MKIYTCNIQTADDEILWDCNVVVMETSLDRTFQVTVSAHPVYNL
jgi:hypothetical protein